MEREASVVELGRVSTQTRGVGMWLADEVGMQDMPGLSDA